MRLARNPLVHGLPSLIFLVLVLGFRHLQKEPYLRALLPAAALMALMAIILYIDAKARLRHSHYHRDFGQDTEQIYFSPSLSPIQKMMIMDQHTGCGTVLVALGYFILSLLFIGIWVLGKYYPNTSFIVG